MRRLLERESYLSLTAPQPIRNLRRETDPLFRRAGMDLDGEDNR